MRLLPIAIAALALATACKPAQKAASTGVAGTFDAAAYLPTYPPLPVATAGEPTKTEAPKMQERPPVLQARNTQVSVWLDTVAARNQDIRFAQGFRLQVYAGQDRAQAMKVKETLYRHFPNLEVYLTYSQPSFRIVCGDFVSRLEAQLEARRLQRYFEAPLIVAGQVKLKKG